MPTPLREKILWRLRFLTAGDSPFPLRDRLAYVKPWGRRPGVDELLMRRLRRGGGPGGGEDYFDLNGRRIYFRPDHDVADEAALVRGTLMILKEAYVQAGEFFAPDVGVTIRPGDTVLDLGGNIGTSALLFACLAGPAGRVFSFEPVFHRVLQKNLEANGAAGNVTVVPKAVSDAVGEAEFAVTDVGVDSRLDPDGKGGLRRRVEVTTIDRFVEEEKLDRVDFIKMDIEGAEEPALRGAARTLRRFRPRLSLASYHHDHGFGGDLQHPKLVRLLREMGYDLRETAQRHIHAWWPERDPAPAPSRLAAWPAAAAPLLDLAAEALPALI